MRLRRLVRALTVGVLFVAAACGATEETPTTGSEYVPGRNVEGDEWVNGIPLYPQAEALNERTEKDGVIAQSFATDRVSPRRLIAWFETELARDDWAAIQGPYSIGRNAYRGRWIKDRSELLVSTALGPQIDELRGVGDRATQFSLTLEPAR